MFRLFIGTIPLFNSNIMLLFIFTISEKLKFSNKYSSTVIPPFGMFNESILFKEETSLKQDDYQIINLSPFDELFMGMNNIRYKNIYYVSQICKKVDLKVDEHNELQKIEISNIQWYTLNQALDIIREYDIEKRNIIINNHNSLKSIFFIFQSLLKNYLKK